MSKNIIRVAHVSDIHVRGLSRHDEYKHVFNALVEDMRKLNVDYVFVAGDIWHTKTLGISPEAIDFLTNAFKSMATVAPVHMMLGNHDMNCVNLQRQDAISPIVNAINDPKIILYKNSGMYEFHPGVVWNIFSLFDEEKWESVKPVKDKMNIACFHGAVRGSLLDSDWAMSEGMSVDFFDNFDLAFLGDIHRQQFLGYREYEGVSKPWIAYPGSMVQQNFAESLTHGYLLWTIDVDDKTHDVEFRPLPNIHPFVTVDWKGNVTKTIAETSEFPEGSRFRIKSNIAIMQRDVAQLISDLKHKKNALEVAFKIEEAVDRDKIKTGSMTIARDDLRNVEVIMELLREHYEQETISEDEWAKIQVIVEGYLKAIHADDAKNIKWSIKKMEWDNTFAYGEGNVINFEKLSGITGIFGPNRTGKSSIVGTLMYSLFNATDRGSLKNLFVINNRKDYCRTNIVLSINEVDYLIERQTVKADSKRGPFGITNLNAFRINKDGSRADLNGEQRNDTDKFIRSLIGTSDDFLTTSVSAQDNLKRYINEGATHRKQTVSRFLDLDIFDRLYDISNKATNGIRALHKGISVKKWESDIEACHLEIKRLEEESKALGRDLPSMRKQYAAKQMEFEALANIKPVTTAQLNSKKVLIGDLEKKLKTAHENVESFKAQIQSKQNLLASLVSACEKIDINSLRERKVTFDQITNSLRNKNFSLTQEQAKLVLLEKSIKKLTTVPCGDQFQTCLFIKDSHESKASIGSQREIVSSLESEIKNLENELSNIGNNIDSTIQKYEKAILEQSKLQNDISSFTVNVVKSESQITLISTEVSQNKNELSDLEKAFQDEQNQKKIQIKAEIDKLGSKMAESEQTRKRNSQLIGREETKIETLSDEHKRFSVLDEELRIQELVTGAFSKRGVPNRVIHSQLPVINAELNKILHGIVNFTVELESDIDTNSLDIFINYGDFKRIVELGSGMEKVVISLALRAALTRITTLPKSDIFIVDEGFADLDPTGIEICNRLIVSFKEFFKSIFIITHIDGIKDIADNLIEITRSDGCSKVVYV